MQDTAVKHTTSASGPLSALLPSHSAHSAVLAAEQSASGLAPEALPAHSQSDDSSHI